VLKVAISAMNRNYSSAKEGCIPGFDRQTQSAMTLDFDGSINESKKAEVSNSLVLRKVKEWSLNVE
jgi:hypothetical protein